MSTKHQAFCSRTFSALKWRQPLNEWLQPLQCKVCPCCVFPWPDPHSYGAPGVEFTGLHQDTTAVTQIHFLPGQVSATSAVWATLLWMKWGGSNRCVMCALFGCRAGCCRCWMTTPSTCGSSWPGPPEKWEGLRKRVWPLSKKWTATASLEDLASRAAGVWNHLYSFLPFYEEFRSTCCFTLPPPPLLHHLRSATRVTVLLLLRSCDLLCIGTEGGGVYFLQLPRLSLRDDQTLLQDQVTQRWDWQTSSLDVWLTLLTITSLFSIPSHVFSSNTLVSSAPAVDPHSSTGRSGSCGSETMRTTRSSGFQGTGKGLRDVPSCKTDEWWCRCLLSSRSVYEQVLWMWFIWTRSLQDKCSVMKWLQFEVNISRAQKALVLFFFRIHD